MPRCGFSAEMASPEPSITVSVVDVYELAADIGKECEVSIEKFGSEAVSSLLPKVINALELLEALAARSDRDERTRRELAAQVTRLENDKVERAEHRQRFEKEIEAIEEQWRTESADLVTAVARLQDENKRLRRTINAPPDGTVAPPSPAREHDQEVLSRLASTAEKQRSTLRHQEMQLQDKQQMIDTLTSQVEQLASVSRELRRKQKQMQNQIRAVCEERSELTAIVQSQQRDIAALQHNTANKQKCSSCGGPEFDDGEMSELVRERDALRNRLRAAEDQLQALQPDLQNSSSSEESTSLPPPGSSDEAPVQGPLPREPDDAPWKRNSGIRKFFRKLFAESDLSMGSLQRRSLSSFTSRMSSTGTSATTT